MDQDNLKNVIDKAFDNISDVGINTKGEITKLLILNIDH